MLPELAEEFSVYIIKKIKKVLACPQRAGLPLNQVREMKKISDIQKELGINRRTLQEYAAKGIVKPTTTTKEGYWLYDDRAVYKLILATIYKGIGYKRTELKEKLEATDYRELLRDLRKKRDEINSWIIYTMCMDILLAFPNEGKEELEKLFDAGAPMKSLASAMKDQVSQIISNMEDEEINEVVLGQISIVGMLSMIGMVSTDLYSPDEINHYIKVIETYFIDLGNENEVAFEKEEFINLGRAIFEDDDVVKELERVYKESGQIIQVNKKSILDAIDHFEKEENNVW